MAKDKIIKAYSIRDIREILGFTQEEFAYLVDISAVYLSQLETGKRPINDGIAEKIAKGLNYLTAYYDHTDKNRAYGINWVASVYLEPYVIKSHHEASFMPPESQEKLLLLLSEKQIIDQKIMLILQGHDELLNSIAFSKTVIVEPFNFLLAKPKNNESGFDGYDGFFKWLVSKKVEKVKSKFQGRPRGRRGSELSYLDEIEFHKDGFYEEEFTLKPSNKKK